MLLSSNHAFTLTHELTHTLAMQTLIHSSMNIKQEVQLSQTGHLMLHVTENFANHLIYIHRNAAHTHMMYKYETYSQNIEDILQNQWHFFL